MSKKYLSTSRHRAKHSLPYSNGLMTGEAYETHHPRVPVMSFEKLQGDHYEPPHLNSDRPESQPGQSFFMNSELP